MNQCSAHDILAAENNNYKENITRQCVSCYNRLPCGKHWFRKSNAEIKEAERPDYEWHDGKMKTRHEYRLLKNEWAERNGYSKSEDHQQTGEC